jgi:hypothetical protein
MDKCIPFLVAVLPHDTNETRGKNQFGKASTEVLATVTKQNTVVLATVTKQNTVSVMFQSV